ncbi:hypothetical protein CLCR_07519 [Cladophialophora carrionii]|uniref:Uncharacterized protein n=1 Tax=Cladophialophora carrionii TaxID=86049 RepID=A0A1C1CQ17_9EURO|nr:hypothetical protein CLCR_07519 [Cladophialophora carrionii]
MQHLPISPSPPHPDSKALLEIEDGQRPLKKNSYVKVEQVRVCSLRALGPHGNRTLTPRSYDLLMTYAPGKPAWADDIGRVERRRRRGPRYIEPPPASSWVAGPRPSAQLQAGSLLLLPRSHDHHTSYDHRVLVGGWANTSVVSPLLPRQYGAITEQGGTRGVLHSHSTTFAVPRGSDPMYGTVFTSQARVSQIAPSPSSRPASEPRNDRVPCLEVFAVLVFLGVVGAGLYGIFVVVKALIGIIAPWIHDLLSGKVVPLGAQVACIE